MRHAIRTAARFPSDTDALEAVHDLEALAPDDQLHVEVHRAVDHELERAENDLLAGVVIGMAVGAPLGVVAGLAVMTMAAIWWSDVVGGMVLGVGIGAGVMFGLLMGGIFGLVVRSNRFELARDIGNLHLDEGEDVVIADLTERRLSTVDDVRQIVVAHRGSFVHL